MAVGPGTARSVRAVRPEDITLLAACGTPSLLPDGSAAVVSITAPDVGADEEVGALWQVPTAGGAPRRLTRGHHDSAPAVSPDGAWVAFLRRERDGRPHLAVVERAGGEPVVLTTDEQHPLGAGAPVWAPTGPPRLAYSARVPEPGRYGTAADGSLLVGPAAAPGREAPRLLDALPNRSDGVGWTRDRRHHLFVLDVGAVVVAASGAAADGPAAVTSAAPDLPAPLRVTDGDADDTAPAWTRDGASLLFVSARHATADTDRRSGVYRVALGGPQEGGAGDAPRAEPALVLGGDLGVHAVAATLDGAGVLALAEPTGEDGLDVIARPTSLWAAPLDASAPPRRLTDPERDLDGSSLVATTSGALVRETTRGAVHLLHVEASADPARRGDGQEPAAPVVLLGGHRVVLGADATPDGSTVVAVVSDGASAGDLVRLHGSALVPLTDLGAPLRSVGVRPLRELTATAPDGYPVHGWVVLPDPARYGDGPHPTLLLVHGGPFSAYTWAVFDEAQVLAGAGYAVVMGNPRGSAGYGVDHGRAVVGAMGGPDVDDVLALLEAALARADLGLDAERTGVMGGSYGGWMSATLTTRTQRFAAAVVERGYLDATSFVGASDIGWFFTPALHGSAAAMVEQSPMTHVGAVRTPTLVIHSEQDWRCPVEQGHRWFATLRLAGVEARMLVFPGEGHELTRSGRPRHRVARHQHVLAWWGEHLPVRTAG